MNVRIREQGKKDWYQANVKLHDVNGTGRFIGAKSLNLPNGAFELQITPMPPASYDCKGNGTNLFKFTRRT